MKRRSTIGLAVLALVPVAAVAVTASARPRTAVRANAITLRLRSQLEHVHYVDNPPAGRSPGDVLVFTERLLNSTGRQVGSDAASCMLLFDQRSLCTGTYLLPGGQVMAQLLQPSLTGTLTYAQAITGGTGRFARASGTVTVTQQPTGDQFVFNVHLS
jgi:hypothetical protein